MQKQYNHNSQGKTQKQPFKERVLNIRGKRPTVMTIEYADGSRQRIKPTMDFLRIAHKAVGEWKDLAVAVSEGRVFKRLNIQ